MLVAGGDISVVSKRRTDDDGTMFLQFSVELIARATYETVELNICKCNAQHSTHRAVKHCHLQLLRVGPRQQEFLTSVVTKQEVCERKEIE